MVESTTEKGRGGEDRAVLRLMREGYEIIGRNVRVARCEVDVIARDGELLCFIEVRLRERIDDALYSVNGKKQARIIRAARAYVANLERATPGREPPRCRFDVVVIAGDRTELVKNAFEATR